MYFKYDNFNKINQNESNINNTNYFFFQSINQLINQKYISGYEIFFFLLLIFN